MVTKRIIKGIPFENGRMFGTKGGRRMLIAECEPDVKIYEQDIHIHTLGKSAGDIKSYRIAVILCGEPDFAYNMGYDFVSSAEKLEIIAEVLTEGGFVEEVAFEDLNVESIDPHGEWVFSVEDKHSRELIDRLLNLKNINTIVGCP